MTPTPSLQQAYELRTGFSHPPEEATQWDLVRAENPDLPPLWCRPDADSPEAFDLGDLEH